MFTKQLMLLHRSSVQRSELLPSKICFLKRSVQYTIEKKNGINQILIFIENLYLKLCRQKDKRNRWYLFYKSLSTWGSLIFCVKYLLESYSGKLLLIVLSVSLCLLQKLCVENKPKYIHNIYTKNMNKNFKIR